MDKYQGQQNEIVLLSLVRTRAVGHLRDVRRLVVAMSRARLGLYIFGRASIFAQCYELQPTFKYALLPSICDGSLMSVYRLRTRSERTFEHNQLLTLAALVV